MAPKAIRGTKRAAVAPATAVPEKKAKVDTELEGVLEALRIVQVPEDVRTMLIHMAPACLLTPASERHDVQASAVCMIGKAIAAKKVLMEQSYVTEQAKLVDIEASRASRELKVTEADAALVECTEAVEAKKTTLGVASQAMLAAKQALADATEAQRLGDAGLIEAEGEKKCLEIALEEKFLPVKEGRCDMDQAKAHVSELMPFIKNLELDESLATAIPCSLPKPAADRGPFDQMVVEQLEEMIREKIQKLSQTLGAGEESKRERAAAVDAAQSSFKEAQAQQQNCASELRTVTSAQKEAQAVVELAKAALSAFEPEYRSATEARDAEKKVLENFVAWNVSCFEILRDRPTADAKTQKSEEAVEVIPSVEGTNQKVVEV